MENIQAYPITAPQTVTNNTGDIYICSSILISIFIVIVACIEKIRD